MALTSRQFAGFAQQKGMPFFSVHAGPTTRHWREGDFETFELGSSSSVVQLEHDLQFDLRFHRHRAAVRRLAADFKPDLIHVTGPGHCGLLGAFIAHDLRVPIAASWHTNIHEFGARRLEKLLHRFPGGCVRELSGIAEAASLHLVLRFYELARIGFAPNPELVDMISRRTGRPVYLMERGIDAELFHPSRRSRPAGGKFVIGYTGRLSAEKSVRDLAVLERALVAAGIPDYEFLIVGDGLERTWLRENLCRAQFTGILRGEALAEAYANMDVFAFPSTTDTFGNVVVEAHASGVPAVVKRAGGPKFLVKDGVDGFVSASAGDFAESVIRLYQPELRHRMSQAARLSAQNRSWEAVMQSVYDQYEQAFAPGETADAA